MVASASAGPAISGQRPDRRWLRRWSRALVPSLHDLSAPSWASWCDSAAPFGPFLAPTGPGSRHRLSHTVPSARVREEEEDSLWRLCVARVGRDRKYGASYGGAEGIISGCSSTTRKPVRPTPKTSRTVRGARGRWRERISLGARAFV